MAQTVKEKRTLVRFAVQKTRYVAGNGAATEWETIKVNIGTTDDGKPITTDCFYVEWLSSYGAAAIQQQSDGVIDDAHAFKLAAAADNYLQQNKMLEFQVKKYEVR